MSADIPKATFFRHNILEFLNQVPRAVHVCVYTSILLVSDLPKHIYLPGLPDMHPHSQYWKRTTGTQEIQRPWDPNEEQNRTQPWGYQYENQLDH